MKNFNLAIFATVALCLTSQPAAALDKTYVWKLSSNPGQWKIGFNTPAACENQMQDGLARWNSSSKFKVAHNGYFSGYIVKDTPNVHISSEPGSRMANGAGTPAEAPPGSSVGTTKIGTITVPLIKDADIRMNADIYAAGNYSCGYNATPTSSQIDYARTVAHEMGHVVGIDDRSGDTGCLTHYREQWGKAVQNPCALEASLAVNIWGAP